MNKEKFLIVFDDGKPYEKKVVGALRLKRELKNFYLKHKDDDSGYYDVTVYNSKGKDISENQFIQEIIGDIIE